jgi:WD40 repeat protein
VAILDGGTFDIKYEISNAPTSSPGASRYRISALCWSPDGTFLAVGGSDGICLVVQTKGYALVHKVRRPVRKHFMLGMGTTENGQWGIQVIPGT